MGKKMAQNEPKNTVKNNKKEWSESELLKKLGLGSRIIKSFRLVCGKKEDYLEPEYLNPTKSNRITLWISRGLPCAFRRSGRFFTEEAVEHFLQRQYKINMRGFRAGLRTMEAGPATEAVYL